MKATELTRSLKSLPPQIRREWAIKCEGYECHNTRALRAMFLLTVEHRLVCFDCLKGFLIGGGDPERITVYHPS